MNVLKIACLAVAYFALAKLGLHFAQDNPSASIVWPASGLAAAATYIWGWKALFGVFAGALAANFTNDTALGASALIGLGNATEAGVIAFLLHKAKEFAGDFHRNEDTLILGTAAIAGAAIAATVGALAIETFDAWVTWWAGDVFGVLLAAPTLLLWKLRDSKKDVLVTVVLGLAMFALLAVFWL